MSKSWHKILLIVVGLIGLGLSGLFISKALGFNLVEPKTKPDNTIPSLAGQEAEVNQAMALVNTELKWVNPKRGEPVKPLPLFVSIPIVEIDGELIDMGNPTAKQIRPPATNTWLLDNGLDFLDATVMSQDNDNDGFSNEEEWHAKSSPIDPASHPAFANKLKLVARRQQEYKLIFRAKPDAERFQIVREPTRKWPKRETYIMRVGETSGDQQFRIDSYEEKQATSSTGIKVDASVLNVTHLGKQSKHQLVRNVSEMIPTFFAEMKFELGGENFFVKEGEFFPLPTDPNTKYKLVSVKEDSAKIIYQNDSGQEQTIEIKK